MVCRQRITLSFFLATCTCLVLAVRTAFRAGLSFSGERKLTGKEPCPIEEGARSLGNKSFGSILTRSVEEDVTLFFFYGYVAGQVPAGILCDIYGGRHVLGGALILIALTSLSFPLAATNYYSFVSLRFADGLCQSPIFPSLVSILCRWAPRQEIGRMVSSAFAGSYVGLGIGVLLGGYAVDKLGGGFPFYVIGSLCIVWYLCWLVCCYSSPYSHPYISEAEFDYLNDSMPDVYQPRFNEIPWREILSSIPMYAIFCGEVGQDWTFEIAKHHVTDYLQQTIGLNVSNVTFYTAMLHFTMASGTMVFGIVFDIIETKRLLKPLFCRRFFAAISIFIPGASYVLSTFCGCNKEAVLALYFFSSAIMGPRAILVINEIELSRTYGGVIEGICNATTSCIDLIISFSAVRVLSGETSFEQWRWLFALAFIAGGLLCSGYIFFCQATTQPFDPSYYEKSLARK